MYAYVFSISTSSLSISLTIFAILICKVSIELAAIIADLLPFAPACAKPLSVPNITTLPPAITSAPLLHLLILQYFPQILVFAQILKNPYGILFQK